MAGLCGCPVIMVVGDIMRKKIKLNLGCGFKKKNGFINIDKAKEVKPDLVHDCEKGLKMFKDNTVDEIYSSHFLEHITPKNYHFLLEEMYRVCKNGAIWDFYLPFDNIGGRTHEEHYRTYSYSTFQHYGYQHPRNYYRKVVLKKLHKNPPIWRRILYHILPFTCNEVHLKFEVVK